MMLCMLFVVNGVLIMLLFCFIVLLVECCDIVDMLVDLFGCVILINWCRCCLGDWWFEWVM